MLCETLFVVWALAGMTQCAPVAKEYADASPPGGAWIQSIPVPEGKAWCVRAAGTPHDDNTGGGMVAMELIRPVVTQGLRWDDTPCCWYVPLARSAPGWVEGTPGLALGRPFIMVAGERISSRVNNIDPGSTITVMLAYYEFPLSCLGLSP